MDWANFDINKLEEEIENSFEKFVYLLKSEIVSRELGDAVAATAYLLAPIPDPALRRAIITYLALLFVELKSIEDFGHGVEDSEIYANPRPQARLRLIAVCTIAYNCLEAGSVVSPDIKLSLNLLAECGFQIPQNNLDMLCSALKF